MASILGALLSFFALNSIAASIDLSNIAYLSEPSSSKCNFASFAILVHSAPSNVHLRDAIRNSWGSVAGYNRIFGRRKPWITHKSK